MKYLLILLAALMTSPVMAEDYSYASISQGIKLGNMPWGDSNWQGDYPTSVQAGYNWDFGHTDYGTTFVQVELQHVSNVLDGPPFNDRSETWLDWAHITVGVKW